MKRYLHAFVCTLSCSRSEKRAISREIMDSTYPHLMRVAGGPRATFKERLGGAYYSSLLSFYSAPLELTSRPVSKILRCRTRRRDVERQTQT